MNDERYPPCQGPDPDPSPAKFILPPGSVDCHAHIFGPHDRYPLSPARGYTPPAASLHAYRELHRALGGIERAVLTQPSVYGTDNACMLDAVAKMPGKFLAIAADVSVGHLGYMRTDHGLDHPGFKAFLDLLRDGNCWVKLTGSYRITTTETTPYHDVTPFAQALIAANEDRVTWGSDWPHPTFGGSMPNDGALLDQLSDWAPDAAVRHKILVDNAQALYGF